MGSDVVINATGTDWIYLWFIRNGKIHYRRFSNRSWIFVSGSSYDLDFLSRQLDLSDYSYTWSKRRDIFGTMDGITIWAMPSEFRNLVQFIDVAGMGRKFRIYNADINPQLRFLSDHGIGLLSLDNPRDSDPEIPAVEIMGKSLMGSPDSISIDGSPDMPVTSMVLGDLEDRINDSIVILHDNRNGFFSRILRRMCDLGCSLPDIATRHGKSYNSYGQVHSLNQSIRMKGKICLESSSFILSQSGLPGLMETSRVSGLPMEAASLVTTGTAVSSMEESYAIGEGILIPLYKDDHEVEKDALTLIKTDMGGMVLQPEPGLYMDIHEIDFSSMYPSIIVNYNLSPETISITRDPEIPGTPYSVSRHSRGFLSEALEKLLKRRLFFKSIRDQSNLYTLRDTALKWMLLTSFGYTGYKNAKFGRIEVHEAITATGRNILMKAIGIAGRGGFHAIHGIVDSLWLQGHGSIAEVLEKIEADTKIGIVEDGHYRWIVFLPSRSGLGALNRYYGLRYDGSFKVRGIEIRRSDSPEICRDFQMEALELFRNCRNRSEIASKFMDLENLKSRYLAMIRKAPWDKLKSGFHVTRHQEEYRVRNLQSSIIREFQSSGLDVNPGERKYVTVVDRRRKRVDPWDSGLGVDIEYYTSLMLRAFEPMDYLMKQCISGIRRQTTLTSFC